MPDPSLPDLSRHDATGAGPRTTPAPLASSPALPSFDRAAAHPDAVVAGDTWRVTVLTSRLLRVEHSPTGTFTDEPTQLVLHRRFDEVPPFEVRHTEDGLDLWTEHLHLRYDKQPFSAAGLSVTMRTRAQDTWRTRWRFGDPDVFPGGRLGNLRGTARTLDDVDGPTELEPGLLSHVGYAVVDDSQSLTLTPDGWVAPREAPQQDLYVLGYGRDFGAALRDWFRLTGPSPLLPRWALGNWWSRYHRYTAEEYLGLMDRFRDEGIPFSVAVLDMDWHLVDIDPSLGTGWTGYTWDRELFPDPAAFLRELHERGLRVALNVHPADGVRRHEDAYPEVARDMGVDPASGLEIAFDITSPRFVESYLRRLHHPHEEIGVDLWWVDWQQGTSSAVPGLDPLWMLNHVHYLDSARDGRRPLTFSRYAGLGSHRYPIGFSGDTITSWASLDFQPYFTATAANVGYFWWSHDIGGHIDGAKDDELAVRWFQLGVLSPVNRLHSTSSPFNSKEPWRFGREARRVMTEWLRLRHRLVPYLYTAMWRAHTDGVGPVRPMYHEHPDAREAYGVPNQFWFGPDLVVAPVTSPADRGTLRAAVTAWLPPGRWYDVMADRWYDGGRRLRLHRSLDQVPVLARAGAVVPLAADPTAHVEDAPAALVLQVVPGADGTAELVEDDGGGGVTPADRQVTRFRNAWAHDGVVTLVVEPPTGPGVRTVRDLDVEVLGVDGVDAVTVDGVRLDAAHVTVDPARHRVRLELGERDLVGGLELRVEGVRLHRTDLEAEVFAFLDEAQVEFATKEAVHAAVRRLRGPALVAELDAADLSDALRSALLELLAAG